MDTKQALRMAEESLELVPQLPENAQMADGVGQTLQGIIDYIKSNERVSPKQVIAIQNMNRAVSSWLSRAA